MGRLGLLKVLFGVAPAAGEWRRNSVGWMGFWFYFWWILDLSSEWIRV
jgi:hypothetical protein